MPSKYAVKIFVENGIYHVYNRGVEKRKIFQDDQDNKVFLKYLKRYLADDFDEVRPRWKKDLSNNIQLLAYCLMGNHFHMLLKQFKKDSLTIFMRCLSNAYTKYFNQKYERVGPLLQGKYKAVLVDKDQYLLHLTRYIHLNPIGHKKEHLTRSDLDKLSQYPYSSYQVYLGKLNTSWIHPEIALEFFPTAKNSYQKFVEEYLTESSDLISGYKIDEDN